MTHEALELLRFFRPGTPVVALPDWSSPRLMLAARPWAGRWGRSRLFPAFRVSARLRKCALRLKSLAAFSRCSAPGDWLLWDAFRSPGLPDVEPMAVLAGHGGPTGKTVVFCSGPQGDMYLKFGRRPAARRRLRQEYAMLGALEELPVPRALRCEDLDGGTILFMTACSGHPLPGTVLPAPAMLQLEKRLRSCGHRTANGHPWITGLLEQMPCAIALTTSLEEECLVCPRHGDFAPWNVLAHGNRCRAVDWEYGSLDGYPGTDLAYSILQCAFLLRRWSPHRALEYAAGWLCRHGRRESRGQARALVALTALDAYLRAREDGFSPETPLQQWRNALWRLV